MKILVIQTAFPGDAILTLPMIQKLYEENDNSTIDVLAIPATRIIFEHSRYVNDVIIYDKKGKDESIISFLGFIKRIRKQKYEMVVSPHRSSRSSLIAYFSGAEQTVSFDKSSLPFLYKTLCHYENRDHEVKRNLSLINYDVSGDKWKILPEIFITEEIEKKVSTFIAGWEKDKIVAIAPGSVWATKRYPVEFFAEIIKMLAADELKIVIIGGKEDEKTGQELVSINPSQVKNLAGQFNIIESIALLRKSCLLISNDSAPAHMGMAADIPVLAIFCSTIPEFGFYPYNTAGKSISLDGLYCKPCGIHGYQKCPESHFKCGYDLSPSIVMAEAGKILSGDIH